MTLGDASLGAKKPVVQVFCRAYLVGRFRENFVPLADRFEFRFLCDGACPGTDDTRADFYRNWRARKMSASLTPAEIDDVLTRCRLLRNIDRREAERMLHAMALTLEAKLDESNPDVVVCHMVDEYVTHLLSILSGKRGIHFLAYVYSYFPGYVQFVDSSLGHAPIVREPTDEEVDAIVARLSRGQFRQDYDQKPRGTRIRQLKAVVRYQVKRAYFALKGWSEGDPLNVHYVIIPYLAEFRRMRDLPSPAQFDGNWRDRVRAESAAGRRTLFLPLAYFPESTTDYWVRNTKIIDYVEMTLNMLRSLGRDFALVVKEHPHMVGARPIDVYRAIAAVDGVILVPPDVYVTDVVDEVDAVVLGGGSGGVEARLRGKPVFSFCDTSYWFEASGASYLDLDQMDHWAATISEVLKVDPDRSAEGNRAFVRKCLRTTARQRPPEGRWPLCNVDDLEAALTQAVLYRPSAGKVPSTLSRR